MVKSSPGVPPKPGFGPNLDLTGGRGICTICQREIVLSLLSNSQDGLRDKRIIISVSRCRPIDVMVTGVGGVHRDMRIVIINMRASQMGVGWGGGGGGAGGTAMQHLLEKRSNQVFTETKEKSVGTVRSG